MIALKLMHKLKKFYIHMMFTKYLYKIHGKIYGKHLQLYLTND